LFTRNDKLPAVIEQQNHNVSSQLDCLLQFSKHHKRRQKDAVSKKSASSLLTDLLAHYNIKMGFYRAFDHVYDLLHGLNSKSALERMKKTAMHQVSSFIHIKF